MRSLATIVVLLFASVLNAGEAQLTVDQNPVPEHSFAVVSTQLEKGDMVSYFVYPEPKKKVQDSGKLSVSGPPGAVYTVQATIVNFGDNGGKKRFDSGSVKITMAGEEVDPDPEPGPNPPPDTSAATLTNQVKAAIKQEPEGERLLIGAFTLLYAKYATDAELNKYKTWGDLDTAMRKEVKDLGASGKLVKVQTAVSEYLLRHLPGNEEGWETQVITDAERRKAKSAFTTVSNALGKAK